MVPLTLKRARTSIGGAALKCEKKSRTFFGAKTQVSHVPRPRAAGAPGVHRVDKNGMQGVGAARELSPTFHGPGKVLGGGDSSVSSSASIAERRDAAAAAAEARSRSFQQGGSASREKAKKLADRRRKDQMLGEIGKFYARKQETAPFGLAAASSDALRRHLDAVK